MGKSAVSCDLARAKLLSGVPRRLCEAADMKRLGLSFALAVAACSRPQPSNDIVLVSNEGSNQVTVLDGATGRIEGQLATGARPRGMALSSDSGTLYVAASDSNRIEAWDVHARRRLRIYPNIPDPERFALGPNGATLAIANEDDSAVSFLDLKSGKVTREVKVGPEPEGIGVSPDGKLVVATSELASLAHFVDAATGKLLDSIPVGTRPRFVLFMHRGRQVWVSSEQRGTISIFDTATRRIVHTIDLAQSFDILEPVQSVEMAKTRDEKRVFVAMGRSNRVAEIDPATFAVVRSFPTGFRTWGVALSPDEKRLYAPSGLDGSLTIVDLERNKVARTVKLGGKPWGAIARAK
jgi:PQQ-dependent catabolism-associated beta-propeller protein